MGAAAERVARVTVHGARGDPAATRGRLDLALGGMTLAPASLPPAAILLVRRVADPLPGAALDPRRRTAWAAAARARMEELARGAARPAAGAGPAGAGAGGLRGLGGPVPGPPPGRARGGGGPEG